jgi:uncharacterized membrane protein
MSNWNVAWNKSFLKINKESKIVAENFIQFQVTLYAKFSPKIVYRVNHSPMKYTIINVIWKHDFYSFSTKLSVLNLHILQVCLWNDCQNIQSNARSL